MPSFGRKYWISPEGDVLRCNSEDLATSLDCLRAVVVSIDSLEEILGHLRNLESASADVANRIEEIDLIVRSVLEYPENDNTSS